MVCLWGIRNIPISCSISLPAFSLPRRTTVRRQSWICCPRSYGGEISHRWGGWTRIRRDCCSSPTNGAPGHRLLAPKSHVDKVYYARLDKAFGAEDQAAFAAGIVLEDGLICMPAGLTLLGDGTEILVTLHEGKFHQIKRMVASRGGAVCYLKRIAMGPLELDPALRKGEYRALTEEEVAKIGGKP